MMISTNLFSPKLLNSKLGLIKEVTQWLPEYDDPRICVVAVLVSNVEHLGLPKIGSTLNSGAGTDFKSALGAAVGESLERYCAALIPDNLTLCSFKNLNKIAVHPSKFQFYSDSQYASENFPFKKFLETSNIAWTEAAEIVSGIKTYVPAATVYLPYFVRQKNESNIWAPVSSGLSCASSPDTAVLSGLFEVIERDAFMLFWLLGRKTRVLDWQSSTRLSNFISRYFRHSIQYIQLLNITTDINVPTILGVYNKPGEGLLVAAASRATYEDAAEKTLLELAQGRITWRKTFENAAKLDTSIPSYDSIRTFEDHVGLFTNPKMINKVPYLFPKQSISIAELQSSINSHLNTAFDLAKHLKDAGYESYCVNLTQYEVAATNNCVYRSLIPGLLEISNDHVWQRLGSNRISRFYNTRCSEEFTYTPDCLNPIPHPFP